MKPTGSMDQSRHSFSLISSQQQKRNLSKLNFNTVSAEKGGLKKKRKNLTKWSLKIDFTVCQETCSSGEKKRRGEWEGASSDREEGDNEISLKLIKCDYSRAALNRELTRLIGAVSSFLPRDKNRLAPNLISLDAFSKFKISLSLFKPQRSKHLENKILIYNNRLKIYTCVLACIWGNNCIGIKGWIPVFHISVSANIFSTNSRRLITSDESRKKT